MHRPVSSLLAGLAVASLLTGSPAAAEVSPLGAHPVDASRAVSLLIAARDVDGGADLASHLAGSSTAEKMLPLMRQMADLGANQYMDRVYERAIGVSSYDIIDKLNFDRAVIFVRYLFSVERNEWRLTNVTFKAEMTLPLPRDWVQIYPDGLVGPAGP